MIRYSNNIHASTVQSGLCNPTVQTQAFLLYEQSLQHFDARRLIDNECRAHDQVRSPQRSASAFKISVCQVDPA